MTNSPFRVPPLEPGKVRFPGSHEHLHCSFALPDSSLSGTKPYIVFGFMYLEPGTIDGLSGVKELARERILPKLPRFRSVPRLVKRFCGLYEYAELLEQDIQDIDLSYHCHVVNSPQQGSDGKCLTQHEVMEFCNRKARVYFSPNRPPWQIYLVENVMNPRNEPSSLLLLVVDHQVGDGQSLVHVFWDCLVDQEAVVEQRKPHERRERYRTVSRAWQAYDTVRKIVGSVIPSGSPRCSLNYPREGEHTRESETKFAFGKTVPIQLLREIKNMIPQSTINEVALAALTIAVGEYLETYSKEGEVLKVLKNFEVGFMISTRPSGVHPLEEEIEGNLNMSLVTPIVQIPVHEGKPVTLVNKIHDILNDVVQSWHPYVTNVIVSGMLKCMPAKVLLSAIFDSISRTTFNMSAIRGPSKQCRLNGKPVKDVRFVLTGMVSTYVGFISYAGEMSPCVCMDGTHKVEDAEMLAELWCKTVHQMHKEVLLHSTTTKKVINESHLLSFLEMKL